MITVLPDNRRLSLDTDARLSWTVSPTSEVPEAWSAPLSAPVPATVPGEIHTDLLSAGLIPDPFDADNESLLAWIGRTNWAYRTTFEWHPGAGNRHELVADGLDTVATVVLNGTEVARTANQHRSYRFDVTDVLVQGENTLVIEFEAPVSAAERLSAEIGLLPHTNHHPYNAIRKMASNYGWDWGPDVAGVGIWQPIAIESSTAVRLAAVRPLATWADDHGQLDVHVDLDWLDPAATAEITVRIAGRAITTSVAAGPAEAMVSVDLDDVEAWWPRGYGDQPLYDLSVTLTAAGGATDSWQGRVGFRTVTLSTTPDETGSEFVLAVNGKPIFAKGANWIPDDAFLTRLTPERYRASLQDAVDAGMNLLRVWGGGIYESEAFYNACDELGLLVWQDFLFACAAYSEDEPLRTEIEAEARQAITRLSAHASLAIWNGCNENIWGYVEWRWRERLGNRGWGEAYYIDLLPKLVAELDPRVPYSPGSPFSYANWHHPNDPRHGTTHIWDVWNQVDYSAYLDYQPRFVSEFGFQGPPAWSTLTSVVHDQPLDPYGDQMLVHQKAGDGNLKLERGLGDHLPRWRNIDEWHWLTQLNQARAITLGIAHFRSLYPLNRGAVVWQLNDNWPVVSWAAVDGHGIRKPLWFALRHVFQDQLVSIQLRDGRPVLFVHNDSDLAFSAELQVSRRSTGLGSDVAATETIMVEVAARTAASYPLSDAVATPAAAGREFLQVSGAASAFFYFVEDPELTVVSPAEAAEVAVLRTDGGYRVTVTANALIKDLSLFPDRLDPAARVDSGLITLASGQAHSFEITSGELDEAALAATPVLRSVNDLIA